MKILISLALGLFSTTARATFIYMDSDSASTTNNSGHATVDLSGTLHPSPSWAPALPGSDWISYGPTGDRDDPGYFSPPDGTVVVFTTTFILNGAITGAILRVMADDSTSVILNGHTLMDPDKQKGATCFKATFGCLFTFASLEPYLIDGRNTLSFGVIQLHGSSFGLDFAGAVDDSTATPEPATLLLISGGLIGLAGRWKVLRSRS